MRLMIPLCRTVRLSSFVPSQAELTANSMGVTATLFNLKNEVGLLDGPVEDLKSMVIGDCGFGEALLEDCEYDGYMCDNLLKKRQRKMNKHKYR
jgi:hypothetical protein